MLHGHGQVFFNTAAADAHLPGHFGLPQPAETMQFQRHPGSGRKVRNRLAQGSIFLISRYRLIRGQARIRPIFRRYAMFSINLAPLPITRHRPPPAAQLIEHEIVGHAKQIGAPIGHGPRSQLGKFQPKLLHQVIDFDPFAAACAQETGQFGTMQFE